NSVGPPLESGESSPRISDAWPMRPRRASASDACTRLLRIVLIVFPPQTAACGSLSLAIDEFVWISFKRATWLGPPEHDFFDLPCEGEVLVRDAAGRVG